MLFLVFVLSLYHRFQFFVLLLVICDLSFEFLLFDFGTEIFLFRVISVPFVLFSKIQTNTNKKKQIETKSPQNLQNLLTNNPSIQNIQIHHIQLDEFRLEIQRRDQEILAMAAKMKTLEEQHQVNIVCFLFYLPF